MSSTLDLLKSMFPGKVMLTIDDLALVLRNENSRATRESVASALRRGDILPGLRKSMGRWLVPITTLAAWLDSLTVAAEESATNVPSASRGTSSTSLPAYDLPQRGRKPDSVRKAAQRERAQQFLG
ncbi:MAG TPA: hypothetical protein PKC03_16225, partial [Dokdonella sp.]|nr:hypothetical protein [Dokdonella sp.]